MGQNVTERDKELSLMQHLTELRSRLMVAAFGVLVSVRVLRLGRALDVRSG